MLLGLAEAWPLDMRRSVLIGDQETDLQAAAAAGIRGVRYAGGNLDAVVAEELAIIRGQHRR
jgi:D-glycero-D-manno-heptose 1,7-bisphosphate phosphatase